jgi:hypothetical protein
MSSKKELFSCLSKIRSILSESKALLEWQKLKFFERSLNPSSKVFFQENTHQELLSKYCSFMALYQQVNLALQDKRINLSQNKRAVIKKELKKLYLQFYYLGSDVRIY